MGIPLAEAQLDVFRRYLAGLTEWNQRFNLTSPSALADAERVHFLDSLAMVPVIKRDHPGAERLMDVGSGAGFPGLVVKLVMPELRVVLLEATRKKAEFLRWAADTLELGDVDVVAERAEEAAHREDLREAFDVVTARALGPLPVALELTLPFCRVGGSLIAYRGADGAGEAAEAGPVASRLGGHIRSVERVEVDGIKERTVLVVLGKDAHTPGEFPRRTGIPSKRPLGAKRAKRPRVG